MCLWESYKKNINLLCILKIIAEESDLELDPYPDPLVRGMDPDTHKNVTDPQHCFIVNVTVIDQVK